MRRLVGRDVVRRRPILNGKLVRTHRLYDFGEFVCQKFVLLYLVVLQIHRYPHQRPAEAICVGGIEVEIDVTVGVEAAVDARAGFYGRKIVLFYGGLPGRTPLRGAGRDERAFDRPGAGLYLAHVPSADKAVRSVIEIIAVEFIDAHANRAGRDERIEVVLLVVEESVHARNGLMRIVAADDACVGDRIVWFSDLRMQQKLHVEHRIGCKDDEIGGLFPLDAARVDEGHAGRAGSGFIDVNFDHFRIVARGEVWFADQVRKDRGLRTCLRVVAASEPFAESAVGAGAHLEPERIRIGLREIAGRLRKWLVAEILRSLAEERVTKRLRLRWRRVGTGTWSFEGIAARLD